MAAADGHLETLPPPEGPFAEPAAGRPVPAAAI
jgi:hypothetical protein